jgi:hypothetical protein
MSSENEVTPLRQSLDNVKAACKSALADNPEIRSFVICYDLRGRDSADSPEMGMYILPDGVDPEQPPINITFGALEVVQNVMADLFNRTIEASLSLRQETAETMKELARLRYEAAQSTAAPDR